MTKEKIDNIDEIKKDMDTITNVTYEDILNKFMNKSDIELKTQIDKPKVLTCLEIIETYRRKNNLVKCADMLRIYIDKFLLFMISYKRLGRKEILEATSNRLSSSENKEKSILEKLVERV